MKQNDVQNYTAGGEHVIIAACFSKVRLQMQLECLLIHSPTICNPAVQKYSLTVAFDIGAVSHASLCIN
jgi:hypothetical protein